MNSNSVGGDGHHSAPVEQRGEIESVEERPNEWKLPFPLGDHGLTEARRRETIADFRAYVERQADCFLGYQANQHAEYSRQLSWMLDHHVNNVGDPFTDGNFTVNSKAFERDVLEHFARLWRMPRPIDPEDKKLYWGYVLTMGSTEGNLYGLWNARDYLNGRALISDTTDPTRLLWVSATKQSRQDDADVEGISWDDARQRNAFAPVAFYSTDTHYSLTKAVRVLGIPSFYEIGNLLYEGQCPLGCPWPAEVPSRDGDNGPGSVDVEALCKLVQFFARHGHPALIVLNVGTTFKGAYDPVAEIEPRIVEIMKKSGLYERTLHLPDNTKTKRHGFWIHVDGALGAAYLPYLRIAKERRDPRAAKLPAIPDFDFAIDHVFSIAMSGHKWIGAPWPCGVYMTKAKYQLVPPDVPEYIGSADTTFAGSRNGFSPVVLWEHLARYSQEQQIERVLRAQEICEYAEHALQALGRELGMELHVARTDLALTVRFLRPNPSIVFKYSLSTEKFRSDPTLSYAHLYVMPGITTELIDRLIDDLREPNAFPAPSPQERQLVSVESDGVAAYAAAPPGTPYPAAVVPLVGRGFR